VGEGRVIRRGGSDLGEVGGQRGPEFLPRRRKGLFALDRLGQVMEHRDDRVVKASAERVIACAAGVEDGGVGEHLTQRPQGRLAEHGADFLNRGRAIDDGHRHRSLLPVDLVLNRSSIDPGGFSLSSPYFTAIGIVIL